MKPKAMMNSIAIVTLAISSSLALASDNDTTKAKSDANAKPAQTESMDEATAQATAQSIESLISSGALEMNDKGELVVKKSVVDTLKSQGRLNVVPASKGQLCE